MVQREFESFIEQQLWWNKNEIERENKKKETKNVYFRSLSDGGHVLNEYQIDSTNVDQQGEKRVVAIYCSM